MNTTPTLPGVTYAPIPSSWENIKRALANAVRVNSCGVVKIVILFDEHGNPLQHTKPEVTKLEPKGNGGAVLGWLEALA